MRELWRNCKGAVTVMVTLLLIPAILITGTGVDLARIYSARSTLQVMSLSWEWGENKVKKDVKRG